MKGILIYQPTSKSAPLADFIDGLSAAAGKNPPAAVFPDPA